MSHSFHFGSPRSGAGEHDIIPVPVVKSSHDHNSRCAISKYNVPRRRDETRFTPGSSAVFTLPDKRFSRQTVPLIAISNL